LDDDAAYDRIDQEEINVIMAEPGGNPAGQVEQGEDDESNKPTKMMLKNDQHDQFVCNTTTKSSLKTNNDLRTN